MRRREIAWKRSKCFQTLMMNGDQNKHTKQQVETVLVAWVGYDLKVLPNFSGPVYDKDFGSKNILGSHMKVVHTGWIIGAKRTQDQFRLAEKERNGSV